jgi:hypothetical protein
MEQRHDIVLGPEQLSALRCAFDAVWDEVAEEYDTSPTTTEVGRLRLANIALSAWRRGASDPATVRTVAVRRMAMWWRHESRVAL